MDFIEGLPLSEGYNTILVVVDRFTKYGHFIPLKHPFAATRVAQVILDNVVKLHGLPMTIVSDRDRIFTSSFWQALFTLMKTKLLLSSSYHPQTDGQTERVNQCLEMYLRCAVHESLKQWKAWLPLAELWYNTNFHTTLGCSPFKALYGYDPDLGAGLPLSEEQQSEAAAFLRDRDDHIACLKKNLTAAHNKMKLQVDKHRTDRQFQVGDSVLLKLQPYVQQSVVSRPYPKLAFKYYGPFEVLEKIGSAAYKLNLPNHSLIHPVFHVSQLKPFTPNYSPVFSALPTVVDLTTADMFPEKILDRRLVKKGNQAIPQILVKWSRLPTHASTWEDYYVVKERFPDALAWGQASSGAGGGVTPLQH